MRREGRIHASPSHPIDCIPFLVTYRGTRRIHKTEAWRAFETAPGAQKTSGERKEAPEQRRASSLFRLDALPHGWLQVRERHSPKAIHTPPFPYLVIKRAEDAEQPASPPHPMYSRGTAVTSQPQASPHLPFFLQFLHFSENRTAVDLKVPGDLGDAAVTFHRG